MRFTDSENQAESEKVLNVILGDSGAEADDWMGCARAARRGAGSVHWDCCSRQFVREEVAV